MQLKLKSQYYVSNTDCKSLKALRKTKLWLQILMVAMNTFHFALQYMSIVSNVLDSP